MAHAESLTSESLSTAKVSQLKQMLESLYPEYGSVVAVAPLGNGHIHDTFLVTWSSGSSSHIPGEQRVHQRLNQDVFPTSFEIAASIATATDHVRAVFQNSKLSDEVVELESGSSGVLVKEDSTGGHWRTLKYIPNSYSVDVIGSPKQAERIAAAFGRFQAALLSLDVGDFPPAIANFHDLQMRLTALENCLVAADAERIKVSEDLIAFIHDKAPQHVKIGAALREGTLPHRVTHNDLKVNNVLLDLASDEAVAVVDLDLLQPGSPVYDFGDLIRSAAVNVPEDEEDLEKVRPDKELVVALSRGYLGEIKGGCTEVELQFMADAPSLLAYTLGVRFLTDYLAGDVYFKTAYKGQNLRRARAQLHLSSQLESSFVCSCLEEAGVC